MTPKDNFHYLKRKKQFSRGKTLSIWYQNKINNLSLTWSCIGE